MTTLLEQNIIAFSFTDALRGRIGAQYSINFGTSLQAFLTSIEFPLAINDVYVIVNGKVYDGEMYTINAGDSITVSPKKQGGGC